MPTTHHANSGPYVIGRRTAAFCFFLDRVITPLANASLGFGLLCAACGANTAADYVFAVGLLLHLTAWFDQWQSARRGIDGRIT